MFNSRQLHLLHTKQRELLVCCSVLGGYQKIGSFLLHCTFYVPKGKLQHIVLVYLYITAVYSIQLTNFFLEMMCTLWIYTLLNIIVYVIIYAAFQSANLVAATQCKKKIKQIRVTSVHIHSIHINCLRISETTDLLRFSHRTVCIVYTFYTFKLNRNTALRTHNSPRRIRGCSDLPQLGRLLDDFCLFFPTLFYVQTIVHCVHTRNDPSYFICEK